MVLHTGDSKRRGGRSPQPAGKIVRKTSSQKSKKAQILTPKASKKAKGDQPFSGDFLKDFGVSHYCDFSSSYLIVSLSYLSSTSENVIAFS